MRVLLAPDSFKEAASAEVIAQAMARGIKRGNPQAECGFCRFPTVAKD